MPKNGGSATVGGGLNIASMQFSTQNGFQSDDLESSLFGKA